MPLSGKTAIITGGGSGIGLACARRFVRANARVVLLGRREDRLQQVRDELGPAAAIVPGDVTLAPDRDRLVDQTLAFTGRVDILVNNAGLFAGGPVHTMDPTVWDRVLNVNLHAVFHLTSRVLPVMLRQKSGCLVHIASVLGLIAAPQFAAYNTAKAGLIHFSRTLAVEYGPLGIRSNTLAPGLIETEMTADLMQDADFLTELGKRYPLGRFGKPGDVAEACLFLASEAAAFITGTVLPVDGGHTAT